MFCFRIQVTYGDRQGPLHGAHRTGVTRVDIELQTGEVITRVDGRQTFLKGYAESDVLVGLRFVTNRGKEFGWYGSSSEGTLFTAEGGALVAIAGQSGLALDSISFYFVGCD